MRIGQQRGREVGRIGKFLAMERRRYREKPKKAKIAKIVEASKVIGKVNRFARQ